MSESQQTQTQVTEFTIDRRKWFRGHGSLESALLRPQDGAMCCLGFYSIACGLSPEDICGKSMPVSIEKLPEQMFWARYATDISKRNDERHVPARIREKRIKELFAERGIKVKFTGRTK